MGEINIESREHLWSVLSEAAELEHVLMCCYLYAMFSMKTENDGELSDDEANAVRNWHGIIRGIAIEEMTHLTLVCNLISAVGGTPSFFRMNFPIPPGPFPDDMVVQLAPFDLEAIQHFIYVERPEHMKIADGAGFEKTRSYSRTSGSGKLMPFAGDYATVGDLYNTVAASLKKLCSEIGEEELFCGPRNLQVNPIESPLPGVQTIHNLESALKAIETILTQGEGATLEEGSHFQRFSTIKSEYEELRKKRPEFNAARPVVRNPVMRPPPTPDGKVHINHPVSSQFVDFANAIYIQMLRILTQVYSQEERLPSDKKHILDASFAMMRALTHAGTALTYLPAQENLPNQNAGMSFAMIRGLTPVEYSNEEQVIGERLEEIIAQYEKIKADSPVDLEPCSIELKNALAQIKKLEGGNLEIVHQKVENKSQPNKQQKKMPAKGPSETVQTGESKTLKVFFDTERCIHARHCVTEKPKVFKANTPGEWIFPDQSDDESLIGVIRTCPSGAITYERKDEGLKEQAPDVNILKVRENGPYAVLADLKINSEDDGYRRVLCRCGQSQKKPYCDNSHVKAEFRASGEPETIDSEKLANRGGPLNFVPLKNGPYQIEGNLEVCAGTGRRVTTLTQCRLCRCGQSKSKPFCDSSHIAAGFIADGQQT